MCWCFPTAVEVDTIDHTPFGQTIVRKKTYGMYRDSHSSFSSSTGLPEKPRLRFGTKTEYPQYYDSQVFRTYSGREKPQLLLGGTGPKREMLALEAPPAPPVVHSPPPSRGVYGDRRYSDERYGDGFGYQVDVVDAVPDEYSPSMRYVERDRGGVTYGSGPVPGRVGLPRGVRYRSDAFPRRASMGISTAAPPPRVRSGAGFYR